MSQVFQDPSTGKFYQEVSGPSGMVPVGGGNPFGAPDGVYPQGYGQPAGQDMNSQLLGTLLPVLLTLPTVTNGAAIATALQAKLAALTPPTDIVGNPTAADHNALIKYSKDVAAVVKDACGNDAAVFDSLRKQVLFSIIVPLMSGGGGGGSGMMIALVLMIALGGFI